MILERTAKNTCLYTYIYIYVYIHIYIYIYMYISILHIYRDTPFAINFPYITQILSTAGWLDTQNGFWGLLPSCVGTWTRGLGGP